MFFLFFLFFLFLFLFSFSCIRYSKNQVRQLDSTVPRRCECVSEWEWDRCSECRVWHMRTKEEDRGTWFIAQSIQ